MFLRKSKCIVVVAALATLLSHTGFSQEVDRVWTDIGREGVERVEALDTATINIIEESDLKSGTSPQMSTVSQKLDNNLVAVSPFAEVAPGTCSVITNMLVEFCQNYPNDSSCKIQ